MVYNIIAKFLVCNMLLYNVNILALVYFVKAHLKAVERYEKLRDY